MTYYQLAHNERDPETKKPIAKVIHNFGRADQLDRDTLVRLCCSIACVCKLTVSDPRGRGRWHDEVGRRITGRPLLLSILRVRPPAAHRAALCAFGHRPGRAGSHAERPLPDTLRSGDPGHDREPVVRTELQVGALDRVAEQGLPAGD